jgi:large subunit ribosomal protein L13
MGTYTATPADIEKRWVVIDAEGVVLGRLASIIAMRLRGKHKATFTPHMDMGDNVIVTNAEKVQLTGNKRADKTYYRHTGYPGGIKSTTAGKVLEGKHPERVVEMAIKRMLPSNRLSRKVMGNLRVYAGAEHPHEAQSPEVVDVASMNKKNTRTA